MQSQKTLENERDVNSKTYGLSEVLGRIKSAEAVDYWNWQMMKNIGRCNKSNAGKISEIYSSFKSQKNV